MKKIAFSIVAFAQLGFPHDGRVEVNGVPIAYTSYGDPTHEAILLVAGANMQLTGWPPELVGVLVKKGYASSPTISGMWGFPGESRPAPSTRSTTWLAVKLLDRLQIRKAHIVGASMGGMIAQILATDWPERTLSLTSLMATDGKPRLPIIAKPEAFAKVPAPRPGEDKTAYIERQTRVLEALGSPAYPTDEANLRERATAAAERAYDAAAEIRQATAAYNGAIEDRRRQLGAIKVPTLVVQGAEDPIVPVEAGRDVASRIPNAELLIIPGMGHEVPAVLAPRVADAIAGIASRHK